MKTRDILIISILMAIWAFICFNGVINDIIFENEGNCPQIYTNAFVVINPEYDNISVIEVDINDIVYDELGLHCKTCNNNDYNKILVKNEVTHFDFRTIVIKSKTNDVIFYN